MAKKKRTTQTAKRKKKKAAPKRRAASTKHITIRYRCVSGKCRAQPKFAHLSKKGNIVDMEAVNTDADITFTRTSPFNKTHIHVPQGTTVSEKVVKTGTFPYDLVCSQCGPGVLSATPPQMIVP